MEKTNTYSQPVELTIASSIREKVLFVFNGNIGKVALDYLLATLEARLLYNEEKTNAERKTHLILVEILQNIYQYVTHEEEKLLDVHKRIKILVTKESTGFSIHSGNFIKEERISRIIENIEKVNEMTPKERKEKYLEVLQNGNFSKVGGAGLGILDIARRSGGKITYTISKPYREFCFFTLMVQIPS